MANPSTAVAGDDEERQPFAWPLRVVGESATTNTTQPYTSTQWVNMPDRPTTQSVQSSVEGAVQVDDDSCLEFLGKRFRLAERVGLMPMLAFAASAKKGLDSDDMEGLAAMYALIRDCLDQHRPLAYDEDGKQIFEPDGSPRFDGASEWQKFEAHCYAEQADGEELMEFIGRAMSVLAARPRKRREISSDSSPRTSEKSKDASTLRATWPRPEEGLTPIQDLGR